MASINTDKKLDFKEFPPVSREMWDKVIEKDLKGDDYKQKLRWNPDDEIELLPFYRSEDHPAGKNPVIPGIRTGSWEIRQRITYTDLSEANRASLIALENGATGLYFDLPSGAIRSVADLEILFEGIILDIIGLHFGPAMSTEKLLTLLDSYFDEKGVRAEEIDLSIDLDPVASSLLNGRYSETEDLLTETVMKGDFKTLAINAQYYGNAGASIPDQVALCLAAGNEYLGIAEDKRHTASKIFFNLNTGSLYFPEIAKIRALRLLWKQVLNEYEPGMGNELPAYIHCETASWNKFSVDKHNNMLRSTTEAMSAILGTSDAFTADRYDLGYESESLFADRIARNIQILLKEESHFDAVSDPAAGSYYLEELTDQISRKAWERFQKIEAGGGLISLVKDGTMQKWINDARNQKLEAFLKTESLRVGVSKYPAAEPDSRPYSGLPLPDLSTEKSIQVDTIELLHLDNYTVEVLK